MALKIVVRKKAEKQLDSLIEFGETSFGSKIAAIFYNKIISEIRLLAVYPQLGSMELLLEGRSRIYRSLVVHKHYKLIYYINSRQDTLYIVALWNTRREPEQLSVNIK